MKTATHTPTPWRQNSAAKTEINTPSGIAIAECHISQMIEQVEKEANAAHIVLAVNSFDALVAALESALEGNEDAPWFESAYAVLQQVRGEVA